jgi:hypothetical protein
MKYPAGWWTAECQQCGKEKVFRYHCHAKAAKFCDQGCRDAYRACHPVKNQFGVFAAWTPRQDRLLRKEFSDCENLEELAISLGKTFLSVKNRAKKLGLVRSVEIISRAYALGGKKNKGNKRPDLVERNARDIRTGRRNPFYGKRHSAVTKKKISSVQKELNTFGRLANDPEFQRRRMIGLHAKPNKPEQIIDHLLQKMFPGEYKFVGNGEFFLKRLNPDFVNINGQKKIIEVFGEQYHDPAKSARPVAYHATEAGRIKTFAKFGFQTLIIWSQEIYRGGAKGRRLLKAKLRSFHENRSH